MARKWICHDCPEDNAIEYYKDRSVARRHAERTGHEVTRKNESVE